MSAIRPLLGIPPSEALVGIARRMRVPFDPQSIHERFEAHPSPRSLLALVEIARSVGIEARAFEADASDLATATLPAVVHLLDASLFSTYTRIAME